MTPAFVARLTPGRSRALAVALAIVVLAALAAAVLVPAILLHRHYDEAIASTADRLERYRRAAAQAPELRRGLDLMKERDARRYYLRNSAPNLAGAELQEIVKSAIESNGGRITTSQSPGPREDSGFRQIVANVQFFASVPNLQRVLHTLETREPVLVVETITLRPTNAFRGFKPQAGQEPEVNVQLDIAAWAMPDAGRTAPSAVVAPPAPDPGRTGPTT